MAVPSSGVLGMLTIAKEVGLAPSALSLRGMSNLAGKTTPDKITDFYSFSQNDIQRYMNAVENTGYTLNSTEEGAIDTLFTDIDAAGIYSKIYGFYPMIGGGQAQGINAKSVSGIREWALDLTFSGGWTFGAYGATGNASNTVWTSNYTGYGSTPLKFSHLGVYITVQGTSGYGWDIGIFDNSSNYPYAFMAMYDAASTSAIYDYSYTDGIEYFQPSNYSGNSMMSYDNSNTRFRVYQNENLFTSTAGGTDTVSGTNYVLGGFDYYNNYFTDNTYGFITFGENLTDTETQDYQAAINAFQTTLGRNVY